MYTLCMLSMLIYTLKQHFSNFRYFLLWIKTGSTLHSYTQKAGRRGRGKQLQQHECSLHTSDLGGDPQLDMCCSQGAEGWQKGCQHRHGESPPSGRWHQEAAGLKQNSSLTKRVHGATLSFALGLRGKEKVVNKLHTALRRYAGQAWLGQEWGTGTILGTGTCTYQPRRRRDLGGGGAHVHASECAEQSRVQQNAVLSAQICSAAMSLGCMQGIKPGVCTCLVPVPLLLLPTPGSPAVAYMQLPAAGELCQD